MNQSKIDAVADAMAEAYRNGGTVAELAEELLPANWQEAYQVQDALDERLGFELTGWKSRSGSIGFRLSKGPATPKMWPISSSFWLRRRRASSPVK